MPRYKPFYTWLVPLLWAGCSLLSFRFPGDEYAMYAISSIVGVWIGFLVPFGDVHSLFFPLSITLAGGLVMGVVGLLMDLARLRKIVWGVLWVAAALLIFVLSVNAYPSIEKALSKNGSWWAYVFTSINIGLYVSILLSFTGKSAAWAFAWVRGLTSRNDPESSAREQDDGRT